MVHNSHTEESPFLPWTWAITPIDDAIHCPSTHHIILVYVLATILTTILGLIVGSRHIPYYLTGKRFGRKNSKSWRYMWALQLTLHLGADFVVAYLLTYNTPGYDQERLPPIAQLALFYTSRPRLAWIALGTFGFWKETWRSIAIQTMITEIIMQLLGCYYLGRTAEFAVSNGYYRRRGYFHWAQLMYGSALATLIMTLLSISGLVAALYALTRGDQAEKGLRTYCKAALWFSALALCGSSAFAGRWAFLVGYLEVAKQLYVEILPRVEITLLIGARYCPPRLVEAAVVWISMNVFGDFVLRRRVEHD